MPSDCSPDTPDPARGARIVNEGTPLYHKRALHVDVAFVTGSTGTVIVGIAVLDPQVARAVYQYLDPFDLRDLIDALTPHAADARARDFWRAEEARIAEERAAAAAELRALGPA